MTWAYLQANANMTWAYSQANANMTWAYSQANANMTWAYSQAHAKMTWAYSQANANMLAHSAPQRMLSCSRTATSRKPCMTRKGSTPSAGPSGSPSD
jgi:hypothetical protein